jgi:hypothetical protein
VASWLLLSYESCSELRFCREFWSFLFVFNWRNETCLMSRSSDETMQLVKLWVFIYRALPMLFFLPVNVCYPFKFATLNKASSDSGVFTVVAFSASMLRFLMGILWGCGCSARVFYSVAVLGIYLIGVNYGNFCSFSLF